MNLFKPNSKTLVYIKMNFQSPLNTYQTHKTQSTLNKLYTILHLTNITSIIYYRLTTPKTPCTLLLFTSELFLSCYSILALAYSYSPVTRTVFLDNLPENSQLPCIDIFVFTSDAEREPVSQVMNTVVSAMSLDYPAEKVTVYLSDDGGCGFTLEGVKECVVFAGIWVGFCRKFGIVDICPKVYFSGFDHGSLVSDDVYVGERKVVEEKYVEFMDRLEIGEKRQRGLNGLTASSDHPPVLQIVGNGSENAVDGDRGEEVNIPSVVYVAREKRPQHPHHFKAGAINALLRVSSIITNSPYILILDGDMYCNDPSSARQSMCFHLDPKISNSLAFVQFPQRFHNVNVYNDIYDGQIRHVFQEKWQGMDGLEGPILSGTCFYLKREAIYGDIHPRDMDLPQLKKNYGLSNNFIKSLQHNSSHHNNQFNSSTTILSEAEFLASSTYEQNTQWGKTVGFAYASVVEDYFTSFKIHCRGWKSVLCNPVRPAFLGTATISLNDSLIQSSRLLTGFVDVAFSRFFPLFYGLVVWRLSLLQSMCYAYLAIQPLCCFPFWFLGILPQLCLMLGIPVYPKATSPWFIPFSFAFLSALSKNLSNVLISGGTPKTWWNEERFWLIKGVTSSLYATIDCIMKKLCLKQASFTTTNKVDDNERIELYNNGKFDFRISTKFSIPLLSLVILNLISFIYGVLKVVILRQWTEFLGQILLSLFVIVLGYPVIEGMLVRTDNASIPATVSLKSSAFVFGLIIISFLILHV